MRLIGTSPDANAAFGRPTGPHEPSAQRTELA